eukprot:g18045.t1
MDSRSRARTKESRSRSRGKNARGHDGREPLVRRAAPRAIEEPVPRVFGLRGRSCSPRPEDTNPFRKPFAVTEEQRSKSIPCDGYLYATLEFSSPYALPPWSHEPPERYNHKTRTDESVTMLGCCTVSGQLRSWKSLPSGWELAEPNEKVVAEVIKPYPWGTHMLVTDSGKCYWTAGGPRPGTLEALWDYEKGIGRYFLRPKFGGNASLHGLILMKTKTMAETISRPHMSLGCVAGVSFDAQDTMRRARTTSVSTRPVDTPCLARVPLSIDGRVERGLSRPSVMPVDDALNAQEHTASIKANLKRRAETVQLVVQFVRVSTEARKIVFDECGLKGYSHDKEDLVELEIVRLVKKFGAGKNSRYAEHVSLAGNSFGQEFLRRILEGAYWERNRHTEKDSMPKLFLNLSRNRILHPEKLVDELKEGKTAGGPMSLATTTDPEHLQREALILLDISDQRDRSASPKERRPDARDAPAHRAAPRPVGRAPFGRDRRPRVRSDSRRRARSDSRDSRARRRSRSDSRRDSRARRSAPRRRDSPPPRRSRRWPPRLTTEALKDGIPGSYLAELQQRAREEEEDKAKIQKELSILTDRLQKVNESLVRKTQARNEYDKTIQETEAAYMKILESSQTLLHVLKRETVNLTKKKQGSD